VGQLLNVLVVNDFRQNEIYTYMVGSSEHKDEPLGSIKCREFVKQLSNC
jgi:hypothetical protein